MPHFVQRHIIEKCLHFYHFYDEGLKLEVLYDDVGDVMINEKIDEVGEARVILHQHQECHLSIDKFP